MTGNRLTTICLAILLLTISGWVFGQTKIELKYAEVASDHPIAQSFIHYVGARSEKPGGIKKMPEGLSDKVFYLTFQYFGENLYIIISGNDKNATLWVDTDFDGDLAEEKALKAHKPGENPPYDFGTTMLTVPGDRAEPRFLMGLNVYVWENSAYVYLSTRSVQAGEGEINGQRVKIDICDSNFDGSFDGYVPKDLLSRSDTISFKIYGGEGKPGQPWRAQSLTRIARIGDTYYNLDVKPDGSEIEISKADVKFGKLSVGCPEMTLQLVSTVGEIALNPNAEGEWELPVGNYRTRSISLQKQEEGGKTPYLTWGYQGGKLARFEISEGKTTAIPAGTPLEIKTRIYADGGNLIIDLAITGKAGENYSANVTRPGSSRTDPRFTIKDREGKVVTEDKFQYG